MARTPNGWPVNPLCVTRTVPGTNVKLTLAKGPIADVLMYVAEQFHKRVEPLDGTADDYGLSVRPNVNNTSKWSEHAGGAAIDLNATKHPNGKTNTFSKSQYAEIKKILAEVDNVVHHLRNDEMHFEVTGTLANVKRVAARLNGTPDPPAKPRLKQGSKGEDVKLVQRFLGIPDDGDFGPVTDRRVREYQRVRGLEPDGVVGPITWAHILSGLAGPGDSGNR